MLISETDFQKLKSEHCADLTHGAFSYLKSNKTFRYRNKVKQMKNSSEKKLSARQRTLIELVIYKGMTKDAAAKEVNVAPQTVSKWFNPDKTPHFVAAYDRELEKAGNERKRSYKCAANAAARELVALLKSPSDKIRLNAAKEIITLAGDDVPLKVDLNTSQKLSDIFDQIGGEGLEE